MGGVDKALIPIAGKPTLRWSLDSFAATPGVRRIVIVTAKDRVATYAALPWVPSAVVAVVPGGATRSTSVAAGLHALERAPGEASDVLLIHDAARPGVDADVTLRVVTAAQQHGAAAPFMPIADTLKRVAPNSTGVLGALIAQASSRRKLRKGLRQSTWPLLLLHLQAKQPRPTIRASLNPSV